MKHKYLQEIFPAALPFPFCEENHPDFDERDTFALDAALAAWLYERLRYFQDVVARKVVLDDPALETFEIGGMPLTFRQCIDRMAEDCRIILLSLDLPGSKPVSAELEKAKDDLFKVLGKVYWRLWW